MWILTGAALAAGASLRTNCTAAPLQNASAQWGVDAVTTTHAAQITRAVSNVTSALKCCDACASRQGRCASWTYTPPQTCAMVHALAPVDPTAHGAGPAPTAGGGLSPSMSVAIAGVVLALAVIGALVAFAARRESALDSAVRVMRGSSVDVLQHQPSLVLEGNLVAALTCEYGDGIGQHSGNGDAAAAGTACAAVTVEAGNADLRGDEQAYSLMYSSNFI